MNHKYKYFLSIIGILSIFQFCAQPGSLTGGAKDTEPPVMQASKPALQARNYKGKKIIIKFDEFLNFNDINSKFLSSPPLSEKPDIKMKGKSLIIKLKEDLKDSVTYVFSFEDAVQDFHENNPIKDFKFVFSTGNNIDTLEASGNLYDALSQKPVEDAYVMLYKTHNDSIPYNEAPVYVARTDSAGHFKIDYIKQEKYKIFALTDIDMNYKYSLPNEQIAYLDSLIFPTANGELQIDTLKAGTEVHKISDGDTTSFVLENDSIIRHQNTHFFPNNLKLFMFQEDNDNQYVESDSRPMKGQLTVNWHKYPEDIKTKALNFDLSKTLIEKTDTGRQVSYWITDKNLLEKDSLALEFSFYNLDSLEQKVLESDTVFFTYKAPDDSAKFEYLKLNFTNKNHLHTQNYSFETDAPVKNFDLSKIKLLELIDTMVVDAKEQKLISALRASDDRLVLNFKRPLVNDLKLSFLDSTELNSTCKLTHSADRKSVICRINSDFLKSREKLKIRLDYDNDFYLNQIQKFTDTFDFVTNYQAVTKIVRNCPDSIFITLNNQPASKPEINIKDANAGDFTVKYSDFKRNVTIALNSKLTKKDSLFISLKTNEGDSADVKNRAFKYEKEIVYQPKPQGIKKHKRIKGNQFYIQFKSPYYSNFKIDAIKPASSGTWYKQISAGSKDSLLFSIEDINFRKAKTFKIAVRYKYKNSKLKITEQTDTLEFNLPSNSNRVAAGLSGNNKISVQVEMPVKFTLKKSDKIRKFDIAHKWKAGASYVIRTDSLAFTDIFGRHNKETNYTFNVRSEDAYATLKLHLAGIKFMETDEFYTKTTSDFDSTLTTSLTSGQVILQILDSSDNPVNQKLITSDGLYEFNNVLLGSYTLKLIYDKNKDEKWSTGNYLKHIQPERVLIYNNPLELKKDAENEFYRKIIFKQEDNVKKND